MFARIIYTLKKYDPNRIQNNYRPRAFFGLVGLVLPAMTVDSSADLNVWANSHTNLVY